MKNSSKEPGPAIKIIVLNKRARYDYHIEDKFEAGIVLTGTEVKSIRDGKITLQESYIRPFRDGIYLLGANVARYSHNADLHYDPVRSRKLLLNKHEINKLIGKVSTKGYTIVPLQIYLKKGKVKLEIAIAKGKDAPDKRQSVKEREAKKEIARVMSKR